MKGSLQLLDRYPELWQASSTLLILEEAAQDALNLRSEGELSFLPLLASSHDSLQQANAKSHFSLNPEPGYEQIIIDLPKAKGLTQMLVHLASSLLSPQGKLMITGENKGGIKSIAKLLDATGDQGQLCGRKLASACHSALWLVEGWQQLKPFQLEDWWQQVQLESGLTLWSLPGVFSQQKLDQGTACLLDALPTLKGRVLDFGCGNGVLAYSMLKRQPELELTLIDDSLLACTSATRTAEENSLSATILCRNGLPKGLNGLDWIISNPPFHQGRGTQYDIAREFLQWAPRTLRLSGQIAVVANQFLAYEPLLEQGFLRSKELHRDAGFKVLWAEKPKKLKNR